MLRRPQDKQPRLLAVGQRVLAEVTVASSDAMSEPDIDPNLPQQYELATVTEVLGAGEAAPKYRIAYDTLKVETTLGRESIVGPYLDKQAMDAFLASTMNTSAPPPQGADLLKKGTAIEGRFGAGRDWYSGKIEGLNSDGTYDVTYDDGDEERGVPRRKLRLPGQHLSPVVVETDVDAPCVLLSLLGISSRGVDDVITGRVVEVIGGGFCLIEFDLEGLGLRGDVEGKLMEMDEGAVAALSEQCDVVDDEGLKVREKLDNSQVFTLHH
jgi:hypothetical protein